jgi:anti-sigma regulatory factor (Ser/Thr protein kinase)
VSGSIATMDIAAGLPLRASVEFRFAIRSTPAALSAAMRMVRSTMEWMAFDQDWIFRTELCLQEALLNAHFHGNEADAGREIRVGCLFAPGKVEMDVEDEGKGYNTRAELNLPLRGNPHGRGLYLIRQFMNSVAIHGNGTRIVMSLKKE